MPAEKPIHRRPRSKGGRTPTEVVATICAMSQPYVLDPALHPWTFPAKVKLVKAATPLLGSAITKFGTHRLRLDLGDVAGKTLARLHDAAPERFGEVLIHEWLAEVDRVLTASRPAKVTTACNDFPGQGCDAE